MSQLIICPTGCTGDIPDVAFSECTPELSWGEIEYIVFGAADSAAFADWEDESEWTTRVAETGADKLRKLSVSGDLPAASADEIIISHARKVYAPATRTINFDVEDISDENYEFARTTACNMQFRMWFFTKEHQFGSNEGILCMAHINPTIERGSKTINKLVGVATWEAQFAPERAAICWTATTFV